MHDTGKYLPLECIDKKFECEFCGRKYSIEKVYRKHLLTHNVGKFDCKTCGKEKSSIEGTFQQVCTTPECIALMLNILMEWKE